MEFWGDGHSSNTFEQYVVDPCFGYMPECIQRFLNAQKALHGTTFSRSVIVFELAIQPLDFD